MAMYLSMLIDDRTATDISDNIIMSFEITKSSVQLSFPVIFRSVKTQ